MQSEGSDRSDPQPAESTRSSHLWRPQPQFHHVVDTADHLDLLNDGGGIAVHFAGPPKSAVHIAFAGSQSETLSVWTTETRSGFRTRPKLAADLLTIRFVDTGAMSRNGPGGSDVVVGFDQALFTSFEDMRHEQASPGFSSITATVSRAAVIAACQTLGGSGAIAVPRFAAIVEPRTVGLVALRRTLGLLCHQLPGTSRDPDLMTPLLEELLVYQFISAWPTTGPSMKADVADITDRPVRTAIDYIEANLGRKIGIAEIAAAAGVSVRVLQIAFKRRLGCSPVQYLIGRRLDRVHAELQAFGSAPVRQVASDWGFVHMSDFTRRYRDRFGHTPGSRGIGGHLRAARSA